MVHIRVPLLMGLLAMSACTEFPALASGECGNRVVEAGEDCDIDSPECNESCRLICIQDTCDVGRVCGRDGICRAPADAFEVPQLLLQSNPLSFVVGDFNDDGLDEVLAQFPDAAMRSLPLLENSLEAPEDMLGPVVPSAAVGDVSGDGYPDLFLVSEREFLGLGGERRVSLWRGAPVDEGWIARTDLPTIKTEGRAGRLLPIAMAPDRVVEVVESEAHYWSSESGQGLERPPVPFGPAELGHRVPIADLDGGQCPTEPPSPRRELVVASPGGDTARVMSSCGGEDELVEVATVVLPAGLRFGAGGALLADVDGDTVVDLLVQDDRNDVLVAYGQGDGRFAATSVPTDGELGRFADTPLWSPPQPAQLLAAGDFDGNDILDLVTSRALVLDPTTCSATECDERVWDETLDDAVSLDFNHDGALDLATVRGNDLTVRIGGSIRGIVFEDHTLRLRGAGRTLVTGDFNRDTIEDVALIESDDIVEAGFENVFAVFGPTVQDWQTERFGPFVELETLVVEQGVTLVARGFDRGQRPVGAFIRLDSAKQDYGLALMRVKILDGQARGRVAGLVVLDACDRPAGPGGEGCLALVDFAFDSGSLSPHDVSVGNPLPMEFGADWGPNIAPIDVDGDGLPEVVVAGNVAGEGTIWLERFDPVTGVWTLGEGLTVGPSLSGAWIRGAEPSMPGAGAVSVMRPGDVDGDGDLDLLLSTDEPLPRLLWIENDDGTLRLTEEPYLGMQQLNLEIRQFEPWLLHPSGAQRWILAGEGRVGIADIDLVAHELRLTSIVEARPTAMGVADVDGDGLRDVLLGTDTDIRYYRATEHIGVDR